MPEAEREILIRRLTEDLIGPGEEEELLESRPSDVYLTGILWPYDTQMGPEEDDRLGLSSAGSDGEESAGSGAEEEVSVSAIYRPSTAGLSFAVEASTGQPVLCAILRFGIYEPIESDLEETGSRNKRGRKRIRRMWQRHPFHIEIPGIIPEAGSGKIIELQEFGTPRGIQLHVRSARWKENRFLVTVTLVNATVPDKSSGRTGRESATLFQVHMKVRPQKGTHLIARPSRRAITRTESDDEDLSTALLYRNTFEFAVGHSCSAEWEPGTTEGTASVVATAWIPTTLVRSFSSAGHAVFDQIRTSETVKPLSTEWLSAATDKQLEQALAAVPDAYSRWIRIQEEKIPSLKPACREQAGRNLTACRQVLERMAEGARRIGSDSVMAESFRLANLAMMLQHSWNPEKSVEGPLVWRPFQMGFILLAAVSVGDRRHTDRNTMDLLWFPTGGGKTEAYLGLIAFLAFYRRLSSAADPDSGAGVVAVMRYTLRLLTTQQFARASAMILACEAIRRGRAGGIQDPARLGRTPFSIGLWVGGEATPNKYELARQSLTGATDLASPKQLSQCPACGDHLKWDYDDRNKIIPVICQKPSCILYDTAQTLPVYTVDDDVYRNRPTLLIGTVDKFAQIIRRKEVSGLFSMTAGQPPDLIIQDELHLISGPLGTISGLYETAIDRLFTKDCIRPKIIGSTATIRRAGDQVKALFDRDTCQFPPAAIDAEDSGFAVLDQSSPGRIYAGITTAGRSAKFTLQAVSASLLQSAQGALPDAASRDNYWTLVSYFNSLRELGGAVVLMQDDVNDSIAEFSARRNEERRNPERIEELTSRRTQDEVREMLDNLGIHAGADGVMDIVLATNMISVGVDIPRLGLMVVNGQPKGISEYIQVTSRVGRGNVPGFIVAILNNAKARDRSHYESFRTWHSTLYRDVEATSVTPFASRARDRALHAVLVALMRYNAPGMIDRPDLTPTAIDAATRIIDYISARAHTIDPEEVSVRNELLILLGQWENRQPRSYWWSRQPGSSLLMDAEKAATLRALGRLPGDAWPTMNNMRSVEPSTPFRLVNQLRDLNAGGQQNAR
jgi:hypothetical protein